MVHALDESWRVLAAAGTLLDLRPLSTSFPIDAVARDAAARVGEGDARATLEDDRASDEALRASVRAGRYTLQRRWEFELHLDFDSAVDMADFLASGRVPKTVRPSYEEIESARRAMTRRAGAPARLRATRRMTVGAYGRADPRRADRADQDTPSKKSTSPVSSEYSAPTTTRRPH